MPFELARRAGARNRLPPRRRAADADDARKLVQRFRGAAAAREALEGVWHYWRHTLGAVQVETPDPALNVLANGWLLYQTSPAASGRAAATTSRAARSASATSCRTRWRWCTPSPRLLREQLLLCASRQFVEGDVQHWWHPPSGRGVRTHCSDDYLWLPLATCRYVAATGDTGVLDERVPFLEGRPVNAGRGVLLRPARPLRQSRRACTSIACARSSTACASASTACR